MKMWQYTAFNGYQCFISEVLRSMGRTDINPAHVEAYLRLKHGTLDSLSRDGFKNDIPTMVKTIDHNPAEAVALAKSYGL